jgi:hypothetical protein
MLRLAPFLLTLLLAPSLAAFAQEDVAPGAPTFKEGDTITFDKIESLKPYLPPEFWDNRDFFFYEGMQLEIGPTDRDYSEPAAFQAASEKHKGTAKIGPEESLNGYISGRPFAGRIDCKGDPQAGAKIAWNFDWRWQGDGSNSRYYYSYWDRGEELPLYYEGTSKIIKLSGRVEPEYEGTQAELFRGDKRKHTFGIEVDAPFDARGILVMTYRYNDSQLPKDVTKNDDTWVYVPTLRRVRRISSAQRTDAVSGTDFTLDDLRSFDGIVPQYKWECLGQDIPMIAPMNSRVEAYPYSRDHNFGPYGLSYADDRWELRKAYKVRFVPNNADHPYSKKDIYIDMQTYEPFYSFAYDRKNELWKIITHNHRWSEDNLPGDSKKAGGKWYEGWTQVPEARDNRANSDIIVNVQTGTGNRIEYWDNHGTPFASKGKIRRYIDIGRLTKGR